LPSAVSDASPWTTSTPFLENSVETPPVSVLTTPSRWRPTPAKSTLGESTEIPNEPADSTSVRTSAARSTALAGMQA
jgi:hypothetical protein